MENHHHFYVPTREVLETIIFKVSELISILENNKPVMYPECGICANIEEASDTQYFYNCVKSWPKFSGDLVYPIPVSGIMKFVPWYTSRNMYINHNCGKRSQRKLRLSLLKHILTLASADLKSGEFQ